MRLRSILVFGLSLLLIGCSGRAPRRPFTIAAAASMQRPLQTLADTFTKQTGQAVTLSFGATGTLATQLEQGAPFDLFLAADEATPQRLGEKGLLESVQRYATGQIVLAGVASLSDLTKPDVKHIAIANPDQAPYGKAAVEALKAAGLWAQVQPKIVLGENIRQAAQFVESGNAEAGLLARSDTGTSGLLITPVPSDLYPPIHQALGVVKGSPNAALAKQFAQFLTTAEAKQILEQYGFAVEP
jgi:molybdate transport system substrate-binding protein